jgi:hypothetical protein
VFSQQAAFDLVPGRSFPQTKRDMGSQKVMMNEGCRSDRAEPIPVQRARTFQEILLFHGYEESSHPPPRLNERACQELATKNDSSSARRHKMFCSAKTNYSSLLNNIAPVKRSSFKYVMRLPISWADSFALGKGL